VKTMTSVRRMSRPRVARFLLIGLAVASLVVLPATTALAAAPNYSFDPGPGSCFLPDPGPFGYVSLPTITAPSVRYTNPSRHSVTVRKWSIIIDSVTADPRGYHYVGSRKVARRKSVTFPEDEVYIPSRSTSNYFEVKIQVRLEVYYKSNSPFAIYTGTSSLYTIWKNGAYHRYMLNVQLTSC
jgi:hypothetical protein